MHIDLRNKAGGALAEPQAYLAGRPKTIKNLENAAAN
jgi:hypothetical protein